MEHKKRQTCSACGNNPTNHTLSWISNTTNVLLEPLDKILINNILGRFVGDMMKTLTGPYVLMLGAIRLISWNTDIEKAATRRARVIWEEAQKRGISMKQLVILGKPVEYYQARLQNGKRIFFESIPPTKKGHIESYGWMDDKSILKKKLAQSSIPTPEGSSIYTWDQAKTLFQTLRHPVIVKPRLGSRGRHTTTLISTEADLKCAYREAKKLCFFVMIEEHLVGNVFRSTCVNGQLVGILEGMPPKITGNGKDTIHTLIEIKNNTLTGDVIKPVDITDTLEIFLSRQGHTLETILPLETTIDLSEKIGSSYGGTSREITREAHPKIKDHMERAARVVDAGVIGFDFIITDPHADPDTQSWGIIECNSLPFINLHHDAIEGAPINVAALVWDKVIS